MSLSFEQELAQKLSMRSNKRPTKLIMYDNPQTSLGSSPPPLSIKSPSFQPNFCLKKKIPPKVAPKPRRRTMQITDIPSFVSVPPTPCLIDEEDKLPRLPREKVDEDDFPPPPPPPYLFDGEAVSQDLPPPPPYEESLSQTPLVLHDDRDDDVMGQFDKLLLEIESMRV